MEAITPRADGVVVRTAIDEYAARVAVVAVGSWATKVLGPHVELPRLTVTQEQPAHFQPIDIGAEWPSFIHDDPARLVAYGLLSPGEGVKVGEHQTGVVCDPDARDFAAEPGRLERLLRYVEEWLPGLEPGSAAPISCLYTTTPTEDFLVDRVGPLVVAAGFSGHGFKFTPVIGRMLADLADGGAPPVARFRLPVPAR